METKNIKIAVVDDELNTLDIMEEYISNHLGYNVRTYLNPTIALRDFNDIDYDLVLLDLMMPEVDGVELMQKLFSKRKDQKILLTTASRNCKKYIDEYDQGNIDCLLKPISSLNLVANKIDNLLRK